MGHCVVASLPLKFILFHFAYILGRDLILCVVIGDSLPTFEFYAIQSSFTYN